MRLFKKLVIRFKIAMAGYFSGNPKSISKFFIRLFRLEYITKTVDKCTLTKYNRIFNCTILLLVLITAPFVIENFKSVNVAILILIYGVSSVIILFIFKFIFISKNTVEEVMLIENESLK